MTLRFVLLLYTLSLSIYATAQQRVEGIVADLTTHESLPFATVKYGTANQGVITDINGRFSFNTTAASLEISYTGYKTVKVQANNTDTIFLERATGTMDEIVIKYPFDKIKRIVNTAIAGKDLHNPDKYDWYSCNIYYKMTADLLPAEAYFDDDTSKESFRKFSENNHFLFSETYTKRIYEKPGKLQDIVIASRFSGLSKTHFTNLVTSIIPFHVYDEQIQLIGNNYLHPVAKGWQTRYHFDLIDEITDGADTIFILKYSPKKGVAFKSLHGTVYINSNGYAISHFTSVSEDTAAGRKVVLEQIYRKTGNYWFPYELNYEFSFAKYPNPEMGILAVGHSIIDSVSFVEDPSFRFDKSRTVIIDKDVDNHTEEEWDRFRNDSLTQKEKNTYVTIDSLSEKAGINKFIDGLNNIHLGRIPVRFIDIDVTRILALNPVEGTRLGLGVYTNDRVSKYFSLGGWFGYGFKDKLSKYGASVRIYPNKDKNNWFEIAYQKNYRSTGAVNIHPEIDKNPFRVWLLQQVDLTEDIQLSYHDRINYLESDIFIKTQTLTPQYPFIFSPSGTNPSFNIKEGGITLRYAYREKRSPVFGYYVPVSTEYPVVYLSVSGGEATSSSYSNSYLRTQAAVSYKVHINRWGQDNFLLRAGAIQSLNNRATPKPLLLAVNGYRMADDFQVYAFGGFMTAAPYRYFSDRYVSFFYRHDFDKRFYSTSFSEPYLGIAHSLVWGTLQQQNITANNGTAEAPGILNESGIILNNLLRFNYLNIAYLGLNIGFFYNINDQPFDYNKFGRFAIGTNFAF